MVKPPNTETPTGDEKPLIPRDYYFWAVMILVTAVVIGHLAYVSYQYYINPQRVYGEWIEIGMPSYDTENFIISESGVMAENRYITTSFTFDGETVRFYSGDMLYEYHIYGRNDERLRRVRGGEYPALFVKKGYEHTILKPEEVGPSRRMINMAEYFQKQ